MSLLNSVILESRECPLGCLQYDNLLFTGHDLIQDLPGEFSVVQCQSCGLIRTNPRPTAETIGFYYPDSYGPYLSTKKNLQYNNLMKIVQKIYRTLCPSNSQIIPTLIPGKMLEIGCASGSFLAEMATQGWQVEGIEFSENAANIARAAGLLVHSGSIESITEVSAPFDLITAWMVIEHLHNPVAALTKLAEWSKPNAYLALSVPNAQAFEFGFFQGRGFALHLPNHLYHFTPTTLTLLLDKTGWQIERIFHQRTLGNWIGGVGNQLQVLNMPVWLYQPFKNYPHRTSLLTLLLYPLAWLLAVFGQTGRMTVWARRKTE